MGKSPSHKFGQDIGNLLEDILKPHLLAFCNKRNLYLDYQGGRVEVRGGKKVSWEDKYGSSHDLDFVIEKGGSATRKGTPVAFIEAAWRRYTKHSRNKAQEIQGAVLPIAEKYSNDRPFLGAVLAGIFTEGALNQLRSAGFEVLYLPHTTFAKAFKGVGINSDFDESTNDDEFAMATAQISALNAKQLQKVKDHIYNQNKEAFANFFFRLTHKLDRVIEKILLTPVFGETSSFVTVEKFAAFLEKVAEKNSHGKFLRYEVDVFFKNGDRIGGQFGDKLEVKRFIDYVQAK